MEILLEEVLKVKHINDPALHYDTCTNRKLNLKWEAQYILKVRLLLPYEFILSSEPKTSLW